MIGAEKWGEEEKKEEGKKGRRAEGQKGMEAKPTVDCFQAIYETGAMYQTLFVAINVSPLVFLHQGRLYLLEIILPH